MERGEYTEDDLFPLSALQHFLFCERQCALIHLEQAWAENRQTAEGRVLHDKAHDGPDETRDGIRTTRGMPVRSLTLGVSGQCDVVEYHPGGVILPVEYKRGKPKAHRADEVQVCAQAICLEEMLKRPPDSIQRAALYYGQHRRRHDVFLDHDLRALTRATAARLHDMMRAGRTPPPEYAEGKCENCSLIELCQPRALSRRRGARDIFADLIHSALD